MSAREMREACARIAKNGAVAAFQQATAVQDDEILYHTRTEVFDAIGKALSECQRQIEALPLAPAPIATPADDAVARALREAREFIMVGSRDGDRMMRVLVAVERAIDILAAERAASGPATGDEKGNNEGGSRE